MPDFLPKMLFYNSLASSYNSYEVSLAKSPIILFKHVTISQYLQHD